MKKSKRFSMTPELLARRRKTMLGVESIEQRLMLTGTGFIGGFATHSGGAIDTNATIELFNSSGSTLLKTTTTDTDGYYHFDSVAPGNYQVFEVETGYTTTGASASTVVNTATPISGGTAFAVTVVDPTAQVDQLTLNANVVTPINTSFSLVGGPLNSYSNTAAGTATNQLSLSISDLTAGQTSGNTSALASVCTDLFDGVGFGSTYTVNPSQTPLTSALTVNDGQIGYLYNHFGTTYQSATNGAGLQLAIWALLYNPPATPTTPVSLSGPNFVVNLANTPASVVSAANSYLSLASGKSEDAWFLNVTNPQTGNTGQGMIGTDLLNFVNSPVKAGVINGDVFLDSTDSGLPTTTSPGVGGLLVTATPVGGGTALTTTTAANGTFSFTNVPSGSYTVSIAQPSGDLPGFESQNGTLIPGKALSTTPITTTVAAGGTTTDNFAELVPSTVSGVVYNDAPNAGVLKSGDAGVATTLTLTGTNDLGQTISPLTTTSNGTTGAYSFGTLRPGSYTVTATQPAAYLPGTDNVGTVSTSTTSSTTVGSLTGANGIGGISLTPASTGINYNFGELVPSSLSGTVFYDANGNNTYGTGDSPLAGVTLTLSSTTTGFTPLTTTTSSTGTYSFGKLAPGTYTITETTPVGYTAEGGAVGSIGGTSSTAKVSSIVVPPNATGVNYNFGDLGAGSISGTVYVDATGVGLTTGNLPPTGSGDTPEAGVTVSLESASGTVLSTTTSASNGTYSFTGLPFGTYEVVETVPSGQIQTGPGAQTALIGDSGFEAIPEGSGSYNSFAYNPTGSSWTFTGQAGVSGNGSGFTGGNASAPQGTQVAFLQNQGSISQTVPNFTAGTYQISFSSAQRANYGGLNQSFQVLIDGNVVGSFNPTSTSYQTFTTSPVSLTAGSHTITFKGLGPVGGDNTVFLDNVVLSETAGSIASSSNASSYYVVGLTTASPNSTNDNFSNAKNTPTISGTVYVDATGVGLTTANRPPSGSGDTGEAGVTVNLYNSSNVIVATTTSAADGTYSFTGQPFGAYTIKEVVPSSQYQTGPNSVTYGITTSAASPTSTNDNFSNYMQCSMAGLTGITYTITTPAGVTTTVTNLRGNTASGDTVTANFTIAPGATPLMLSLVAYEAPTPYYSPSNAYEQVITSVATGTFGPGAHSITVVEPNSDYQVDFVCGAPLPQLELNNNLIDYQYENRLISADNGGTQTYALSTISGTVYVDANASDSFSTGDTVVATPVTLTLSGTTGTGLPVSITQTFPTGAYSFTNVAQGTYTITETTPAGYTGELPNAGTVGGTPSYVSSTQVGAISMINLNSNTTATSYNFGEYQTDTVSGTVYVDANGNDTLDSGDTGLGGITVTLLNASGATVGTTTSAANGTYSFTGVVPGSYSIQEGATPGYNRENANPGTSGGTPWWGAITGFNLTSGTNDTGNNFGQYIPSTISGTVYVDANGNDTLDSGDTGLGGITVTLLNASGATVGTTTSAANGTYSFTGVVPGSYSIQEGATPGYNRENANPGTSGGTPWWGAITGFNLTSGTNDTGNNFGQYIPSTISGTVYVDATGAGLTTANQPPAGSGDTGEAGVTVGLYNTSAQLIATTITASNGTYSFPSEPLGTYGIAENVPSGQYQTGPSSIYYVVTTSASTPNSTNDNFSNYMQCSTAGLSGITYTVYNPSAWNGCGWGTTTTVTNLRGNTASGDTVTANFTIAPGSAPVMLSLVAYSAPTSYYSSSNAYQQVLTADSTGTFGPGTHTLTVTEPNGYYQIDFVCGSALTQLEANGARTDYNYENRLISADNGGCSVVTYCPAPIGVWQSDIGSYTTGGTESYNNGKYTLTANNGDIWNNADQENYVYQALNGDGELVTRVSGLSASDGWAKAGIQIRNSLAANSAQASILATESNGIVFQDRETTGGSSNNWQASNNAGWYSNAWGSSSVYLKLVRSGSTITAYDSSNGINWCEVGTDTISMSQQVYIGLAVSSHTSCATATANFDNVSTTGYWSSCAGQSLIQSFGGCSTSTSLSYWLANTYPNIYGSGAGCDNLSGLTNNGVASFCKQIQAQYGTESLECQTLSAALEEYSTNWSLGGSCAQSYGFNVSWSGLQSCSYNTAGCTDAFNTSTANSWTNVWGLLGAENSQACGGILYAGNSFRHGEAASLIFSVSTNCC